jgi:oligoendopeptidase F
LTLNRAPRRRAFPGPGPVSGRHAARNAGGDVRGDLPDLDTAREILRAKAGFFGRKGIWFFEREAPLPLPEVGALGWRSATAKVATAFTAAYPDLADYFPRMLKNRWIESEARPGKRPGAFCTDSP